jgi:hypothetical protein
VVLGEEVRRLQYHPFHRVPTPKEKRNSLDMRILLWGMWVG